MQVRGKRGMRGKRGKRGKKEKPKRGRQSGERGVSQWREKVWKWSDSALEMSVEVSIVHVYKGSCLAVNLDRQVNE